ncbi:hypothetical protein OROMI_001114 [Orobanche minor]
MTPTRGRGKRGGSITCLSRHASSSGDEPNVDDLTLLDSDDESDIERDGRIALRRNAQRKITLHQQFSRVIRQSFKRIANSTGFSWKLTLQPAKLQFFDEVWKRFSWPPSWENDVYRMWESRARIRYRDYIHDMKVLRTAGDLGRPDYCSDEMWTKPDGPGSGISKHRGDQSGWRC